MNAWADQVVAERRWIPQDEIESKLAIADSYIVVPKLPSTAPVSGVLYSVYDVAPNVTGGRDPKTYSLIAGNFPAATQMEPNGRLLLPLAGTGPAGTKYVGTVQVRDANDQLATFQVSSSDEGTGPLVLSGGVGGHIPACHAGVPFAWQLIAVGGTPPWRFQFNGLTLPAIGFTFDAATGLLLGTYTGFNTVGNLVEIFGWNAGNTDNGSPDAELALTWDLLNP